MTIAVIIIAACTATVTILSTWLSRPRRFDMADFIEVGPPDSIEDIARSIGLGRVRHCADCGQQPCTVHDWERWRALERKEGL